MSLQRDRHPGTKLSSLIQNDGDLKINGKFAIGFKDGQLVDQYEAKVMDQGLASGFFDVTKMSAGKTSNSSLHIRLESDRIHGKTGDYGINLNYIDSELGDVAAYTYKKASIDGAIKYLSEFVNDTNNSQHILYHYIAQLAPIFGIISGTTPLGSSLNKEDAKRAVLSNLQNYKDLISFPDKESYDALINNLESNPGDFHALENTIRITLDLRSVNESFTEPFDVVIDFNGTETSFINLRIENLKWENKYAMLDVGIIDAYDDGVFNYKKAMLDGFTLQINNKDDLNKNPYIDLSDLPILLEVGINTTRNTTYHLKGNFNYSFPLGRLGGNVDLDIFIEISDKINPETGLLYVTCYIMADQNFGAITAAKKYCRTSFFIKENIIYIKRKSYNLGTFGSKKSSNFEYFKITSENFLKDILYHICITICHDQTLLDFINKNASTEIPTKPLDFIQQFNLDKGNNKFTLQINGNVFGGIALKGPIEIYFDPITHEISSLKVNVGVLAGGIFDVKLNADIVDDNSAHYLKIYNDFIYEFENSPKTKDLNLVADINDTENIYKEVNLPAGSIGVLGGNEPF